MLNLIVAAIFPHILSPFLEWVRNKWRRLGVEKLKLQVEVERELSLTWFEL